MGPLSVAACSARNPTKATIANLAAVGMVAFKWWGGLKEQYQSCLTCSNFIWATIDTLSHSPPILDLLESAVVVIKLEEVKA